MAPYVSAEDDDSGGEDLLFFALVIAGGYFIYQWWRDQVAAGYGGGAFQPSAPAAGAGEQLLNILVPLSVSPTGVAFIKAQEGFSAYPNASGDIGYGHHIQPGESIVPPITKAEGEALFGSDLAAAESAVNAGLQVQVSQSQFDSLVDLAFNIGRSAFLGSSLLRILNGGDYAGAAAQFGQWIHSGGQVNSDLVARRQADQNLFLGG